MAREKLGELRANLKERYAKRSEQLKPLSMPELIADKLERTLWSFAKDFGVDYPVDFDRPPPDVYVPARQLTKCLEPEGTTDGMTPPTDLSETCLTWKARDNGFFVMDTLDFIFEDPIAEEFFTLEYKFDEQVNNAVFQEAFSTPEPGHWKFNRIVLVDGEVLTVCVRNTNAFAGGCFSLENRNWSL